MTPRADDADELLVAAGAGDRRAFRTLHDLVVPLVYANVWRVLRDRTRTETVAQEALVEVWRQADRFDPSADAAVCWILDLTHQLATERDRDDDARVGAGPGAAEGADAR